MLKFLTQRLGFIVILGSYQLFKLTYLPNIWADLYSKYSPLNLLIFGTLLSALACYSFFGAFLFIIDVYLYPENFKNNRVQPKKSPNFDDYGKALSTVGFNLGVLALPFSYALYYLLHPASPRFDNADLYLELHSIYRTIWDITICVLVEEILFYYSHRLFHLKWFYSTFHKKHHEFTAPIAVYTTPVDFIVSNLSPLLVGPLVTKAHPTTVMLYFIIAIINTVVTHGGYTLPFLPDAKLHDFHHETFDNMFGVIGVLDFLHGTDAKFRARYNLDKKVEKSQ